MNDDRKQFQADREINIGRQSRNPDFQDLSKSWFDAAVGQEYHYNFTWLGLPVIQFPQDIVALQEIIWKTAPDVIIETGIARGGSLMLSASILKLLDRGGRVIGVDIDIRTHNRAAIEGHSLSPTITLVEGSSSTNETFAEVKKYLSGHEKVMVILDSNHTHDHVMQELRLYSQLVSVGHYLVVMDTVIEDIPEEINKGKPWSKDDNPKTAVHQFLSENDSFELNPSWQNKLMLTVAPDGYLMRVKPVDENAT